MIDFPASPTVGQIFKTGNYTYRWDGSSWLSNPPNSAITDAPNDGLIYGRQSHAWVEVSTHLKDGTVAKRRDSGPNGPDLGWYRQSAGRIATAYQGLQTSLFTANSTSTVLALWPQTAGQGGVFLNAYPATVVDSRAMVLNSTTVGHGISESRIGTAISKPLQLNFPSGVQHPDGTVAAPGISFASEPGLGWYRYQAGQVFMTCGGVATYTFGTSSTDTTLGINSMAVGGQSQVFISNAPGFSPNFNALRLTTFADGSSAISTGAASTAGVTAAS